MHYVIIGNGIAGINAAQVLRSRDEESDITIIGDESQYFYARTALMWAYMGQISRRDMEPYERRYWQDNKFQLIFDLVLSIDTGQQQCYLNKHKPINYDRLLMATGSEANKLGWPGQDLDGVITFTSLSDLDNLEQYKGQIKTAVVVGGGLIGIELVEVLRHEGVTVTFLIREPWYFNLALSKSEANIVHNRLIKKNVDVIYNDEIKEIRGNNGCVSSLSTKQGRDITCDIVGLAVGVHPRVDCARESNIKCDRGIIVDQHLRTSEANIWAAGDCAEIHYPDKERGLIQALWYTAKKQGSTAACSMIGDDIVYKPGIPYNSAQFIFLDYVTVGWTKQFNPDLEEFESLDQEHEHAIRISYDRDKRARGFSLLGPRYHAPTLKRWIIENRTLDYVKKRMKQAEFNEEFTRVHRMKTLL